MKYTSHFTDITRPAEISQYSPPLSCFVRVQSDTSCQNGWRETTQAKWHTASRCTTRKELGTSVLTFLEVASW